MTSNGKYYFGLILGFIIGYFVETKWQAWICFSVAVAFFAVELLREAYRKSHPEEVKKDGESKAN